MKHLYYGGKQLLVDDEIAEGLIEYAAALARSGGSDTITVQALGADGDEVEATMVLNANSQVIAETSHTRAVAPSDPAAVAYLRVHTRLIDSPPPALPETGSPGVGTP